jgi:hypothetical protein
MRRGHETLAWGARAGLSGLEKLTVFDRTYLILVRDPKAAGLEIEDVVSRLGRRSGIVVIVLVEFSNRNLHVKIFDRQIKIRISNGDPTGHDIPARRGIETRTPGFKMGPLVRSQLVKRLG